MQSRILAKLDLISCQLANMHRKKGDKKIKPDKQFQPDYVLDAKKKAVTERRERRKMELENIEELKAFWKAKNPEARIL